MTTADTRIDYLEQRIETLGETLAAKCRAVEVDLDIMRESVQANTLHRATMQERCAGCQTRLKDAEDRLAAHRAQLIRIAMIIAALGGSGFAGGMELYRLIGG